MYACSNRHFDYANARAEKTQSNSSIMLPGKCILQNQIDFSGSRLPVEYCFDEFLMIVAGAMTE